MNGLGEIVTALRQANGWTLMDMAKHVSRHSAKPVRHQSIQQLESRPHTQPRYIVALAAAFGKSVEELQAWQPGMATIGPNRPPTGVGVREVNMSYGPPSTAYTADELDLLDDYRMCTASVRKAIRVIAAASRRPLPGTKPNG